MRSLIVSYKAGSRNLSIDFLDISVDSPEFDRNVQDFFDDSDRLVVKDREGARVPNQGLSSNGI